MLREAIGVSMCAAGLVLGVPAGTPAQGPSAGKSGMIYAPIDTTKNLAAPIPLPRLPVKKSFFGRVRSSVASLNPFAKKPDPVAPVAPTTKLPANAQPTASGGRPIEIPHLFEGKAR